MMGIQLGREQYKYPVFMCIGIQFTSIYPLYVSRLYYGLFNAHQVYLFSIVSSSFPLAGTGREDILDA